MVIFRRENHATPRMLPCSILLGGLRTPSTRLWDHRIPPKLAAAGCQTWQEATNGTAAAPGAAAGRPARAGAALLSRPGRAAALAPAAGRHAAAQQRQSAAQSAHGRISQRLSLQVQ